MRNNKSGLLSLRNLFAFLPLCLILALAVPISVANAQLVTSSRDAVVEGSVIDMFPFDLTRNGDDFDSTALIGNLNGFQRKAVYEFDISDVVPGVLESARISGRVFANNGLPLGERRHFFKLLPGDGVVNTQDNIDDAFSFGFINHDAGDDSDYDFDATPELLTIVLENTGHLKQLITPSSQFSSPNDPQGWDASSATLELTLRPTNSDTTVYYQAPFAGGEALANESEDFSVDLEARRMTVVDRRFAPFEKTRGIVEYDVSSIPASAEVLWAVLDVSISGFSISAGGTGPALDIVGYLGDGAVTGADADPSAQWLGSTGEINSVGRYSWEIDPEFVETVLQSGNQLGLLFQPEPNAQHEATITLVDTFGDEAERPRLAIAYTVPNVLLGDVNLDGAINFLDINPFVSVLFSGVFQAEADCDGDDVVGFLDIAPFITILSIQ